MSSPKNPHPRGIILAAIALSCLIALPSLQAAAAAGSADTTGTGTVIVRFEDGAGVSARAATAGAGVRVRRSLLGGAGLVVAVPQGVSAETYARTLATLPGVAYAEPDVPIEPALVPTDPGYPQQWAYSHIQAPSAWDVTTGSAGIVVAVVDTGVDLNHPDLVANLLPGGYDFGDDDADPDDYSGHGTHVAGIIAAELNNGIGVTGTAPGVSLLPVKVFTDSGDGTTSSLADGIRYATDHDADIINLSLGGPGTTTYLEEAVAYARANGVVMVAATGNTDSALLYPAASPGVVGVAATTDTDARATYSNHGAETDLSAPGSEIYSTIIGGYGNKTGTSMAAPHVAGAIALLSSAWPGATPEQLVAALQATAVDMGEPGWDELTGFGRIQIRNAIDHLGGTYSWDATAPVTATDAVYTYVDAATITLLPSDVGGSGVAATYYRLDGAAETSGTVVTATGYGTHTLTYRSVDLAGNPERTRTLSFRIVEYLGPEVVRVSGSTRYETCVALSQSVYAGSSITTAVIASGERFADALSASALAGAYDSPLLLTARTTLPETVKAEIDRLGVQHVIIVGGTAAVGTEVVIALEDLGLSIDRVAGSDRYDTAARVALEVRGVLGIGMPKTVFVARGDTFPDALALAALSAGQGMPVLLTRPEALPVATASAIESVDAAYVVVAGGTSAVSDEVAQALDEVPGIITVTRVQGSDRYATAAAIASYGHLRGWAHTGYIGLGTGANFPDALSGGVVAGAHGGVLLLTRPDVLSPPARDFIIFQAEDDVVVEVFGGQAAVSDDVFAEVAAIRF